MAKTTVKPRDIDPGSNGQILTTIGGQVVWGAGGGGGPITTVGVTLLNNASNVSNFNYIDDPERLMHLSLGYLSFYFADGSARYNGQQINVGTALGSDRGCVIYNNNVYVKGNNSNSVVGKCSLTLNPTISGNWNFAYPLSVIGNEYLVGIDVNGYLCFMNYLGTSMQRYHDNGTQLVFVDNINTTAISSDATKVKVSPLGIVVGYNTPNSHIILYDITTITQIGLKRGIQTNFLPIENVIYSYHSAGAFVLTKIF